MMNIPPPPRLLLATFVTEGRLLAIQQGEYHHSSDSNPTAVRKFLKPLNIELPDVFTCIGAFINEISPLSPMWAYLRGTCGAALILKNVQILPDVRLVADTDLQNLATNAQRSSARMRENLRRIALPPCDSDVESLIRERVAGAGPNNRIELRVFRRISMDDVEHILPPP